MSVQSSFYRSHSLFPNGLELSRGIDLAAEQGYSFVKEGISEQGSADLEKEILSLPLELGDHVNNPIYEGTKKQITQLHERAYYPVGDPIVPVATFVTRALALRVKEHRFRYPEIRDWKATEAGYQLYRDPEHHISPHRDRNKDRLLAATITIRGHARVSMYEPLSDPDDYTQLNKIDEFRTEPGSIMFLRAPGLNGGEQIIHGVSGPENGPRLILNLRMRPDILPSPSEMAAK